MTNNITPFNKFKEIKKVTPVNEMVEPINDMYRVTLDVDVPKQLINAYIKKVKDETNKDLRQSKSEMQLAEKIVQFVNETYIVIENLPVDMTVSTDSKAVQGQAAQGELPAQPAQAQEPQVQVSQPGLQSEQPAVQVSTSPAPTQGQAQKAASEISAQEI